MGPILLVIYMVSVVILKHPGAEVAAYSNDIGIYLFSFSAKRLITLAVSASAIIVKELEGNNTGLTL